MAFLAAFLMICSIVLAAPAAQAGEKKSKTTGAAAAPVTVPSNTTTTETADAGSAGEVDRPAAGDQKTAESSAQTKSSSVTTRASGASASRDTSTTTSTGGASAARTKTSANSSRDSSTKSTNTKGSGGVGNPNAGCYPLPQNSDTGHGANTRGVYDSTCDGSPSLNGNGNGSAVGRPCAGCVGKADYKNPKGQMPNALLDGNRGYECDNNQGIGKTNPAHTGCKVAGTNPPPVVNKPPIVPPPTEVPPGRPPRPGVVERPSVPDEVLPLPRIERDVLFPSPEKQPVMVAPSGGQLPFTGSSETWLFLMFGCGLIGAGWMALFSLPLSGRRLRL